MSNYTGNCVVLVYRAATVSCDAAATELTMVLTRAAWAVIMSGKTHNNTIIAKMRTQWTRFVRRVPTSEVD